MAEDMRVEAGGCACGALRFHARGEPLRVGLCHCMTCRRTSGSAFNAFAIYPRARVAIQGRTQAWRSSATGERRFCPRCGAQVFATEDGSGEIELRLGAFDRPNLFAPTYEAWIGRREDWLHTTNLVGFPGNRPPD
jgi:hypothetical protein